MSTAVCVLTWYDSMNMRQSRTLSIQWLANTLGAAMCEDGVFLLYKQLGREGEGGGVAPSLE